jgi:hypothetical protein
MPFFIFSDTSTLEVGFVVESKDHDLDPNPSVEPGSGSTDPARDGDEFPRIIPCPTKRRDPIWAHFHQISTSQLKPPEGEKAERSKVGCNICLKLVSAEAQRLRSHFEKCRARSSKTQLQNLMEQT